MSRKLLFLPVCLSLAFIACKDAVEDHIKSNKITAEVDHDAVAVFKAKVRSSVGSSQLMKANTESWKDLHVGQIVRDNDQLRTKQESEVILNTADGTVFIIAENSNVEFNTELKKSIKGEVNIYIRNGNIQFDVQKQKDNQFNFKTGTATASIRGTAGFVGSLDGQMVASLKEGLVEVKDAKGRTSNITQNQTLLVTKSGEAKTIPLESSGTIALFAALEEMSKSGGLDNVEELEKNLQAFDAKYVDQKKEFEQNLEIRPVVIPKAISRPTITLKAQMTPGVYVTVMGQTDTVPASGVYERTFTWGVSATGKKRFMATCSNGSVEVPCNVWETEYEPSAPEAPVEEVVEDTLAKADTAVVDSAVETAVDSAAKAPAEEVAAEESKAAKPAVKKPAAVKLPEPKAPEWVLKLMGSSQDPLDTLEEVPMKRRQALGNSRFNILLYKPNCSKDDNCLSEVKSVTVYRNDEEMVVFQGENLRTINPVDVTIENGKVDVYRVVLEMNDKKFTDVVALKTFQTRIISSK